MKVAWFTPVGRDEPAAEYSRAVLEAMAGVSEPVLCCEGPPAGFPSGIRVLDFTAAPDVRSDLEALDALFYVIGNDADRYASIFEMSRRYPGIVVLRDPTLHRFFLDYYLRRLRRPDLYVARMGAHYGAEGLATAHLVLGPWFDGGEARIEERDLLRYPLGEEALRTARGAVIHSRSLVAGRWDGPVCSASEPAGLFTSADAARDYAQSLLRFAEQDVPPLGGAQGVDEGSRDLAERIGGQIGGALAGLGATPDTPGVDPLIRAVSRFLWPPSV